MSELEALTTFFTQGYINYFSCGFKDGNWFTCLAGGRILPAAFIAGFWGTVKVLTTQFGLFSQLETPPYEGPAVPGARVENVQVFYYVLDTLTETFWMILELTLASVILWYTAIAMIGYNAYYNSFVWYGVIGIVQLFAMVFWTTQVLIRVLYNLVNLDYLITKYDIESYSTITFYDPVGITGSDLDSTETLIWFEQLLFGNRRSQLYANIMMSIVFSLHPMTMIMGWFFLFQVPAGLLLEAIVYPTFPQYDTPYIPWTVYLEYVINGFQHPETEEADVEKPKPKKDDERLENRFIASNADYVVFGDVE